MEYFSLLKFRERVNSEKKKRIYFAILHRPLQSHPFHYRNEFLRILDTPSYHEAIVHDHSLS